MEYVPRGSGGSIFNSSEEPKDLKTSNTVHLQKRNFLPARRFQAVNTLSGLPQIKCQNHVVLVKSIFHQRPQCMYLSSYDMVKLQTCTTVTYCTVYSITFNVNYSLEKPPNQHWFTSYLHVSKTFHLHI